MRVDCRGNGAGLFGSRECAAWCTGGGGSTSKLAVEEHLREGGGREYQQASC